MTYLAKILVKHAGKDIQPGEPMPELDEAQARLLIDMGAIELAPAESAPAVKETTPQKPISRSKQAAQ